MDILTSIQSYSPIVNIPSFQTKWNADDKTRYDKAFVDKIDNILKAVSNESISPDSGLSSIHDLFDDYWEQLKDSLNENEMGAELTVESQMILNAYLLEASNGCPKAQAIKRVALYLCEGENVVQAVVESYLASSGIDMIEAGSEENNTTTSIHEDKVIVAAYKGAVSKGFSEGKEAYTVVADALDISPREVRLAVEAGNTSEGKMISNDAWTKINEAFGKVNENKFPTGGNSYNVQRFKEILSGAGMNNDYSASVLTNMYGMYKGSLDESVTSVLGPIVEKWSSKVITSKEVFDHFHKIFNEAKDITKKDIGKKVEILSGTHVGKYGIVDDYIGGSGPDVVVNVDGVGTIYLGSIQLKIVDKVNEAREIPAEDIVKINAFIEKEIANGIFDKFDREGAYADDEYSEAVLGMALFNYGYTFDDYRLKPFDLNGIIVEKLNKRTDESVDNLTAGMTFFDSRKGLRARILSIDNGKISWHYYDKTGTTPDMDKQDSLSDDQFKYLVDSGAYKSLRAKGDDPFTANEKADVKASPELTAKAEKTGKPVTYNKQKTDFCYVSHADDKFTLYDSNGGVLKTGSHVECLDAKAKFIGESIFGESVNPHIPQDVLDKIVAEITNLNFTNGTMDDPKIQADVLAKYGFDKDEYTRAMNTYAYEQKVYEFVRKSGSKWKVYSHRGKTIGTYETKADADTKLMSIRAKRRANEIKIYEAISTVGSQLKDGFHFSNLSANTKVRYKATGKTITLSAVGADGAYGKDDMGKQIEIKSIDEIEPIEETAYNEPKLFISADSIKENEETKVSKEDLERVRDTMIRYSRTSGYMDMVGGKLTFFDGNPKLNGVGAAYVTMDDINTWIEEHGKENTNEAKIPVRVREGFENIDSIDSLIDRIKSICPEYTEKTSTPNLTTFHDENNRLIGQWHNTDNKGLVLTEMIGDPDYFYDESASASSARGYQFMPPYGYNDMPIIEDGTEEDAEEYMAKRRERVYKMNMMRASLANQLYQKAFLDLSDEEQADVIDQVNAKMNTELMETKLGSKRLGFVMEGYKSGDKFTVVKGYHRDSLRVTVDSHSGNPSGKSIDIAPNEEITFESEAPNGNVWFTYNDMRFKTESGSVSNMINSGVIKIKESICENGDAGVAINSEYKFFVVNKDTKKIVWGSEYKEDAQDYKKELSSDDYGVYGTSYIKSTMSIDPFNSSNWANK